MGGEHRPFPPPLSHYCGGEDPLVTPLLWGHRPPTHSVTPLLWGHGTPLLPHYPGAQTPPPLPQGCRTPPITIGMQTPPCNPITVGLQETPLIPLP